MNAPAEYVAGRRIGGAPITVMSEGTLEWTPKILAPEGALRQAIPELTARGTLTLGLNLVHAACGAASIVIDPGCDDPSSSWQQGFAAKWPGLHRSPGLQAGLAVIGVNPADVTHVVITHAHADHFAGVTVERNGRDVVRFPNARHFIGRKDWEESPARKDPVSDLAVRLGAVARAGLLELLDTEREVAPGVTMIPAPGETPGHCVVRVHSGGECFYYVGDLFHHPCEVEHADWIPAGRDLAASRASRARVFGEIAARRATAVFSHDRFPAWGRVVPAGDAFRWERDW
jgi:glyoxylase-like metal-dependent hydrolase (beta-lactamase superfamily II)